MDIPVRLLMEVLGEQDRYQEAEECYQYLLTILAREGEDEGSQPTGQTQDVREFLLTRKIHRKRPEHVSATHALIDNGELSSSFTGMAKFCPDRKHPKEQSHSTTYFL